MKVILTPGHSATSPGRCGPTGLTEREVVEAVARGLVSALGRRLVNAEIMAPPGGDPAEAIQALADRIADERYDVDMLLSLHCAWSEDASAYGTRSLYPTGSEESRLLAECLLRRFPHTRWACAEPGEDPLLHLAACPSAVIELDHLSNPEVEQLMRLDDWREKVAANLVAGIFSFIGPQDIRVMVDGAEIYSDPAPQEVFNDVMVPVRVIGSALGAKVRWDPRRRVVTIESQSARRDS